MLFVGCTSGFFCAALLGKGMYEGVHFAFLASKANEERPDALERDGAGRTLRLMARHYARNGVPSLVPLVRFLGRARWLERTFSNAASFLRRRGWASGPESAGTLFAASFLFMTAAVFFYRTLFRRGFAGSFVRASCRRSLPVQGTRSRARPSPRPGARRLKVHGSVPSCGTIAAAGFCRGCRRDGSARERAVFPRFSRP